MDQAKDDIVKQAEASFEVLEAIKLVIAQSVFGQERVIELTLSAILAGGHALLIGAPGLAKTRLVETIAKVLGLDWKRIQFTPDLMPSDILGSELLDEDHNKTRNFRFVQGPVFTSMLMADEINRASPRTQSALLQAMQEQHVTIAGNRYDLPKPFHVLATQNPIEQEGTYPLPEAQLDRFLLKIDVDYPDSETERQVLLKTTGLDNLAIEPKLDADGLKRIQMLVRQMPVGEKVLASILELVRSARPEQTKNARVKELIEWGPSPRAGQALILAARARALLRGRFIPAIEDVEALAEPALAHRMAVRYSMATDVPNLSTLIQTLVDEAIKTV